MCIYRSQKKFSISKEPRLVYEKSLWETVKSIWSTGKKTTDVGTDVVNLGLDIVKQGLNGVKWFLNDFPKEVKRRVKEYSYGAKEKWKTWKEKKKEKPQPKDLAIYRNIPQFYDHPTKKASFKVYPKGSKKKNFALRAAKLHARSSFLEYLMNYQRNFIENAMKEYKLVMEKIIKLKKKQIQRKKDRVKNASQLERVENAIAGGWKRDDRRLRGNAWFGSSNPRLNNLRLQRRRLLSKQRLLKYDVSSVVDWPKFALRKVKYPNSAKGKTLKEFFVPDRKKTRKVGIFKLKKGLEKYIKKWSGNIPLYSEELDKCIYWRNRALKVAKTLNPKEMLNWEKYKKYVDAEQEKHLTTLKPKVIDPKPEWVEFK